MLCLFLNSFFLQWSENCKIKDFTDKTRFEKHDFSDICQENCNPAIVPSLTRQG